MLQISTRLICKHTNPTFVLGNYYYISSKSSAAFFGAKHLQCKLSSVACNLQHLPLSREPPPMNSLNEGKSGVGGHKSNGSGFYGARLLDNNQRRLNGPLSQQIRFNCCCSFDNKKKRTNVESDDASDKEQVKAKCTTTNRFKPSADYYDPNLSGLSADLDETVELHKLETMVYNSDRDLKDEQAKLVAPGIKQSPVALMTLNPAYRPLNEPLCIDYHGCVDNLRLNNTGYFWDVKIPYQISMLTSLGGAQLPATTRYRLDQFHCHWGEKDSRGSEHSVDSRHYSAEMHFLHYNMDKYRTLAQAARHPDGLAVVAVFLEVRKDNINHAEVEKIASNLNHIPLRGEHTIMKQGIRLENLLPQNRSFWSYEGSLTTTPFYESVTWFVMKHPIQCSVSQLQRFRAMKSTLHNDDLEEQDSLILKNFRDVQPMNGRTIYTYDDHSHSHFS